MSADPTQKPASPPFAGYEGLKTRQVVASLSDHSQTELAAVEAFERSHENRRPILDKLRYMRQAEPMPGYDELSTAEIVSRLRKADMNTIKRVRGYERKFANRRDVLEEVVRVHHQRRELEPNAAAAPYVPASDRRAE